MKKVFFLVATVVAAMTLASCNGDKIEALQKTVDSLQTAKDLSDKELSDKLQLINEVEQNFTAIKEAQGLASDIETTEGVNPDKKAQMQENFKLIQNKMAENEQKIADLEAQLKESNGKFAALRNTIASLRRKQEASEKEIATLKEELEKKNVEIAELKTTHETEVLNMRAERAMSDSIKDAERARMDREMHSVFYLIDTKKNLKAKGLKVGLKKAEVNDGVCTKVDYREFEANEGMTFKKEPVLYTLHPKSSYSIVKNADKTYTFKIKDPARFWTSKYMVMQAE